MSVSSITALSIVIVLTDGTTADRSSAGLAGTTDDITLCA